jgi:hypothetical protein
VFLGAVVFGWRLIRRQLSIRDATVIAIIALVFTIPWLLHIYRVMGGLMPSSGLAEAGAARSLSELVGRTWVMVSAIIVDLCSVLYLPVASPSVIAVVALAPLILILVLRVELSAPLIENGVWICAALVLALYYVLFSTAGHFYARYLAPFWLAWT